MRSMTGFGQGTSEGRQVRVQVTVKTVNHRYLDLALRLRDELRPVEKEIRDAFTSRLYRGRVEVSLELERLDEPPLRLVPQRGLAGGVRRLREELAADGLTLTEPSLADLLRIPEAVRLDAGAEPLEETELGRVVEACQAAVEGVVRSRESEGRELRHALATRIDGLREVHGAMAERAQDLPAQMAKALEQRLEQLIADRVDADRVAQEVAHLADRSDVSEELDRLASHLVHFTELLDTDGSVGKRMDFLAQEIFRELNTIGSKCRDSDLVRSVLDGKVLCEQLREQVQNVE